MNSTSTAPAAARRGRFLGIATGLFVAQIALVFVFAERSSPALAPAPPPTRYLALNTPLREDQLLTAFFAGDPSLFARPSLRGFSGRGWLSQPPEVYHPSNELETPIWLELDVSRLAMTPPSPSISRVDSLFLALPGNGLSSLEPLPVFLPAPVFPTQSVFRLEGELRDRWKGPFPLLPAQLSAQLLTNSIVELAVNAAGDVLVHRLLARSGSAAADDAALRAAKALRFAPSTNGTTGWGQAIFEWHTAPETNTAAAK